MEKLNINTQNAKNNMKLNSGQINTAMTREELELFSNGNLKAQQGCFSGDSLSSTPEHHNKKIGHQNGQGINMLKVLLSFSNFKTLLEDNRFSTN